jgi:hypothetical protein
MPLNPDEEAALQHLFNHHPPSPQAISDMFAIRDAGKTLVRVILDRCPRSADRSAAIRHVREAIMTANASIVFEGKNLL